MVRRQWCREHIDEVNENCDIGDKVVSEVKKVSNFCKSVPAFEGCATRPVYRLISYRDEKVRNHAISLAEKRLNRETPTGGKREKELTEPEIKKILEKAIIEIYGSLPEKKKNGDETPTEIKPKMDGELYVRKGSDGIADGTIVQKPASPYQPQPNSIPVTNDPAMRPLSEIADLSKLPSLSPDAPMDEVMKRDELLLKIHNVPSEFKTGSEIQKEVINGGLVTKPLPYKISPEPMTEKEADELILQVINRWFAPKSKELWETILTSGELSDSPARLFEALVCRIGGE
jgi:hypothetical protein